MPLALSHGQAMVTIAVTLAILFLPGVLAGAIIGLRGWLLAATAPVVTYGIAGIAGPWLARVGVPFTVAIFMVVLLVLVACCAGIGMLRRDRRPTSAIDPIWRRGAQLAVLACVLAAAAIGGVTVLSGMGNLAAVPQDWDAAFHANGIRYIAETGDSSLTGMSSINQYGDGTALFYPNAYHLVGAVVFELTGAPIPAVLNAHTVLLPGLLALSLVAMLREFRSRAVLAGFAALLVTAPATLLYASMERGPLLTFLQGLVLVPAGIAVVRRLLTQPGLGVGFIAVLGAAGLLAIHPSAIFCGLLFAIPLLAQRWATTLSRGTSAATRFRPIAADLLALGVVGLVTALLTAPHLVAAYNRPEESGLVRWPAEENIASAIGSLVVFNHDRPLAQLWLGAALLLGVVLLYRLGELRWLGGTALLTGAAWVAVSTSDDPRVVELSQPLWNDPWRFAALAALPLTVLAAHGLAELHAMTRRALDRIAGNAPRTLIAAGTAVAVIAGFSWITEFFYTTPNSRLVSHGYDMDTSERVSTAEVVAMRKLSELAGPGEWAMNDRFDGMVWTYAISNVRTVAAHYDRRHVSSTARLLAKRFKHYRTDPAVRAAVDELNVRWVIIGKRGFVHDKHRMPGLVGHRGLPFLTTVYENDGAVIYQVDRNSRQSLTASRDAASPEP